MKKIIILGSGMAGYGAANRFHSEKVNAVIYEKNSYYGGNTASHSFDSGFIIDKGPHVSFTKKQRLQELFANNISQEYEVINAYVNNYWKGHWIKHPAQVNLHGIPENLLVDILKDFIDAKYNKPDEVKNYADWLTATYGESFAKTFPMAYTRKYHTTPAENMSVDWLGPRMYQPDLEEVLKGALSAETEDVHYISNFRYPRHKGFMNFMNPLPEIIDINLNHKVIAIDPKQKKIEFSNSHIAEYDEVISSIPLPDLIKMIKGVPQDVVTAASLLACTNLVVVSIGIDRADISEAHWTYIYDEDITFTRLSFPHKLSPKTVPEGAGCIQAEVYFSEKYKPMEHEPEEYTQLVIDDLVKIGLMKADDNIIFKDTRHMKYANVIFDLDRADALKIVHEYLDDIGISYAGRYGEWDYIWTDQAFISGEKAAKKIIRKP